MDQVRRDTNSSVVVSKPMTKKVPRTRPKLPISFAGESEFGVIHIWDWNIGRSISDAHTTSTNCIGSQPRMPRSLTPVRFERTKESVVVETITSKNSATYI